MSGCRQVDERGRVIDIPIEVESAGPDAIAAFLASQQATEPVAEDVNDE
jgi:hypothetical protein